MNFLKTLVLQRGISPILQENTNLYQGGEEIKMAE